MNNAFNSQILAEKLSKLNNSQQSIETLSHWCIFHRKKARQVVETWEKLFNSCQKERRISFLYLANDILQNSRRKGSEFVNEFWKVLPKALKDVSDNGDDHAKNAVIRLVDIWEERKVFGSHGRTLKDEMVGKDPPKDPPTLSENNGKGSNSIKIVKKDAHFIRLKLAVGGMPEKIVSAIQSVHDEHFNEDTALNKCKTAVRHVEKMEKDVEETCTQGSQQGSSLVNELEEQETNLKQGIQQLESVEATRAELVARLKEALLDQESKLELVRTQRQIAQAQAELAMNMRKRLTASTVSLTGSSQSLNICPIAIPAPTDSAEMSAPLGPNPIPIHSTLMPQPAVLQPVTAFTGSNLASEDLQKKAAAAAMVAKLTASTSSAQMLSSVLSSLAAEEAAAATINGGGMNSSPFTSTLPIFPPEKRPKLEKPMPVTDVSGNTYFTPMSQTSQLQPPFSSPPPLPPGPPQSQQYLQSNGMMVGIAPYGYNTGTNSSSLPPPPPITSNMLMGLARPSSQPQTQPQQSGYYQSSSGMGFYGQSQPPATTPVPRQ